MSDKQMVLAFLSGLALVLATILISVYMPYNKGDVKSYQDSVVYERVLTKCMELDQSNCTFKA